LRPNAFARSSSTDGTTIRRPGKIRAGVRASAWASRERANNASTRWGGTGAFVRAAAASDLARLWAHSERSHIGVRVVSEELEPLELKEADSLRRVHR
jgi:hypothetical protein